MNGLVVGTNKVVVGIPKIAGASCSRERHTGSVTKIYAVDELGLRRIVKDFYADGVLGSAANA